MGAGFVQRVSGFGLGIFAMLFMPHFLPAHISAPAICCLFSVGTSSYNALRNRKKIPFRVILPLLCTAIVTIPIAVYFSAAVPAKIFQLILGAVLIGLSLYFLFFEKRVRIRPTVKNGLLAGAVSGTLSGLFSTGGPPVVLYLTQALPDKIVYFAAIQCFFALTGVYATVVRIVNGVITAELLIMTAVGFIGCAAGNFLGSLVFDRLDAQTFRRVIYIGMIISGVLMIV